jgi:preprotein translocase subunit SecF
MKMLTIIRNDMNFSFSKYFNFCLIFSGILVVASLFLAGTRMNFGVDFSGGAEIQVKFNEAVKIVDLRETFIGNNFASVAVQTLGEVGDNTYLVKVAADATDLNGLTAQIEHLLSSKYQSQGVDLQKVDIVGPRAGKELRLSGLQALGWALIAIMVYIALRFDFKYAPGAIVAVIHDVILVMGVFALAQLEFSLQTVAALLAVIGYSVNDTVIIYDRVREFEGKSEFQNTPLLKLIDVAINETLSRTILTSGTTLLVALIMMFVGGGPIRDFFFAISFGVVVGTYSTIFIATPMVVYLDRFQQKRSSKKGNVLTGTVVS